MEITKETFGEHVCARPSSTTGHRELGSHKFYLLRAYPTPGQVQLQLSARTAPLLERVLYPNSSRQVAGRSKLLFESFAS